jgi:hypothetical protein
MSRQGFRLVQPWGTDPVAQSTTVSVHNTVKEAFAEIERLADRVVRSGGRSDEIALVSCGPGWLCHQTAESRSQRERCPRRNHRCRSCARRAGVDTPQRSSSPTSGAGVATGLRGPSLKQTVPIELLEARVLSNTCRSLLEHAKLGAEQPADRSPCVTKSTAVRIAR